MSEVSPQYVKASRALVKPRHVRHLSDYFRAMLADQGYITLSDILHSDKKFIQSYFKIADKKILKKERATIARNLIKSLSLDGFPALAFDKDLDAFVPFAQVHTDIEKYNAAFLNKFLKSALHFANVDQSLAINLVLDTVTQ